MSQYVEETETRRFVYGWDNPLQSYFFQVHDKTLTDPEADPIILWLGATADTQMYEVKDLIRVAEEHGVEISNAVRTELRVSRDGAV